MVSDLVFLAGFLITILDPEQGMHGDFIRLNTPKHCIDPQDEPIMQKLVGTFLKKIK
jgi:hypothetical protein